MKRNAVLTTILMLIFIGVAAVPALANSGISSDLAQVRRVTAAYHSIPAAVAAGYQLVPGLDYCFNNPGVGGMGYHYINTALLDTTLDPLKPEAMVYSPNGSPTLQLGAVEYIVPASLWDASLTQPPTLFGQTFGLEKALGVYELHAWIWKNNPTGILSEWNPSVSCATR
jgi:hypothetical protein